VAEKSQPVAVDIQQVTLHIGHAHQIRGGFQDIGQALALGQRRLERGGALGHAPPQASV
jgi:hypothetical protein